jgi:hypothetical protein
MNSYSFFIVSVSFLLHFLSEHANHQFRILSTSTLFVHKYFATAMNSTCIDMRVLGPNIYMYIKGKIYKKTPLKEYKNRKDYYTSNTLRRNTKIEKTIIHLIPSGGIQK